MLAAGQGRAPLRRRDARRRRRLRRSASADRVRRLLAAATASSISGLGYYPNPLAPDAGRGRRSTSSTSRPVIRAAAAAGRRRGQHVHRPRLDQDGRRTTGRASSRRLAAAGRVRRGARRPDRHRELPDALHRRRVAGRQEPAPQPGHLAAHVRRHPERELRPELRPLAPRLAADGLPEAAARVPRPHLPRPRQGRAGRPPSGSTTWASWPTPLEFHTPKLPGLGDVDWGRFFSVLSDTGYDGPVCVEVEDRAYEGSLELRQQALRQSLRYLRNFA